MSNPETEEAEELTIEELTEDNDARLQALIHLLVKKKLITEEEFEKAYDDQFEG